MYLRISRHTLLRLLTVVLLAGLVPPFAMPQVSSAAPTAAVSPTAAGAGATAPSIAPVSQPIASTRAPHLAIIPANQQAHAALAPIQRPISQHFPLAFTPNTGQTDPNVLFQAKGVSGQLFFTQREVVIALPAPDRKADRPSCDPNPRHSQARVHCRAFPQAPPAAVARMSFIGANPQVGVVGTDRLPGVINLLRGTEPARWHTQIPTYHGIVYQQLYRGVDLRYEGVAGHVKSTYTVAPGADPSSIRWRYQGATDIRVSSTGDLQVVLASPRVGATTSVTLTEQAPAAWQVINGVRRSVSVAYRVGVDRQITFALGSYDTTQPLVIDPTLTYSTFLGGNGDDSGLGITVDAAGNSYIAGMTYSTNFTTTGALQSSLTGAYDAFITKLSADGQTVLYSTYLGGSSNDRATGIALDSSGNIAVVGTTTSSDLLPSTAVRPFGGGVCGFGAYAGCEDAFVALLNASGSALTWSTYLGGVEAPPATYDLDDGGNGVAIDPSGNVYVTGYTSSSSFPVTSGVFDTSCADGANPACGSSSASFVTKLAHNNGQVVWSTFLDGTEGGAAIAVDATGHAYVAGTSAVDFLPSSPRAFHDDKDVYVVKLSNSATSLVYGSYLGGSGEDYAAGIALDTNGNAYVTGRTASGNDFPTVQAFQPTTTGAYEGDPPVFDAFVTKFNATGTTLLYSTFLGGDSDDAAYGITLDRAGRASIVGETMSTDLFQAPNDFPTACSASSWCQDAFIATLTVDGRALRFGSYLGGNDSDGARAIAEDQSGNLYVTGYTISSDFRTANPVQSGNNGFGDAFAAKISNPSIGSDEQRCHCGLSQPATNNPINSRTGNYWTTASDLSVLTPGPAITWSRVYASQAITDTTGTLSPGWQYPYAAHIITPTTEPGRVIVLSGLNNRERFTVHGASYDPFPGVSSTLVRAGGVFTQTLRDQQQLVFDAANGKLVAMRDTQGRRITLTYSGTPAHLTQIADANDSARYLSLTYTGAGQVYTVSDGTRAITYTYTLGDLTGAQDVMGRTTTYSYTNHLLTAITNPLGQTVEQMQYDAYTAAGKVVDQVLQDSQHLQFRYLPDTTVITTTGLDGRQDIQQIDFAPNNAMVGMKRNGQSTLAADFDDSFSPSVTSDGNGNVTHTTFSANGLPVRQTNALGQTTRTVYDTQNHPISTTDTLGVTSLFRYDTQGNVISTTIGITDTNPIGATSLYTYSYNVRYPGDSRLQAQRGPDGVVTHYDYSTHGQVTASTIGYGTSLAQTTTTGYDALGRVLATTSGYGTALARTDHTVYNADSTVAQTIQNYHDGVFNVAHPDEDIITAYGYDLLGRRIWTRDALGHYDVTHYNAQGQVAWSAHNLTPLQFDSQGQPVFQSYSPAQPDANVATLYGYDGLGRTTLVTQTGILTGTFNTSTLQFSTATSRVTKTEYDALSRPITVTLDYGGLNVQTVTYYDGAGNLAWQRDALGRWTKTDYDALSRPITTTVNYQDGNPLTGPRDADIVSVTHYDGAGRVDMQIDNAVDGTFTATEPITDRVTLSAYDIFGRVISSTLNYAPGESSPTLNRVRLTAYDPVTMQMQGQRDPLGRWVSQQYDLLGRVTATIQNCRSSGNVAVATGCATFDANVPDKNVPAQSHYDALGRVFETVDALGHTTHTKFDGLGRAVATTQNYVSGGSVLTDTNVTTRMAYDVLGHTTVMTDALGHASYSVYNGLGQTSIVTDTMGRTTRMGYDGTGTLRWSKRNDGQLTVYQVDGLGRTVATIVNYQDGVVGTNEPADRDLISRVVYDAAGRKTKAIDPAGQATQFAYDNQDHLVAVTEHAVVGTCTQAPCNVVTQYQYDRAGNRTAIIDANSHVRKFSYDAADQTAEARDALNQVTSWDYDVQGRVTTQHDPRGTNNNLSYSYDGLDRLTQRSATNLGTISAQYDALGRRTSLTDGTGTTSFGYDALGRMRSVQAPNTGHLGYDYDAQGARTKLIYPDSTVVQYGYWPDGQLRVVTGTTTLANYTYDTAGRLQQVSRANSATTTYSYDGADRLTDLATTLSSTPMSDFAYQPDRIGQRIVVTETLDYTGLVSDIQSGSGSSSPSGGVTIGTTYFFSASDGSHGAELWKSDGTTTGTVMVKDINPGTSGGSPNIASAAVLSGTLFFSANDGTNGTELWKSDGTTAGTVLVKDIRTGLSASLPGNLTVISGTLFFSANDGTNGTELWKSDGTSSGTVLVKDIQSGSGSSFSGGGNFTVMSGTLFFNANDGTNGLELWKSDGTGSGTVLVKDIQSGSGSSLGSPPYFTVMSGTLYFNADDGMNGTELWKSDGTGSGTVLVKDIKSGSNGSGPANIKAVNGTLFFSANDGINGTELWKSDGTGSGTVLVKDINPGSGPSNPGGSSGGVVAVMNGTFFFIAFDGTNGYELWKSDGTATGTVMVKDINPSLSGTTPGSLTVVNNRLFFTADNGTSGVELWTSDGTTTGTVMVRDIRTGSTGSSPSNLRASANSLFLSANDGTHGQELWTILSRNRTVQYSYDGLQRLNGATETPGTTYGYNYDDVGNRTGVWVNGTRVVTQTYNAANQVDGFTYDAAGNLTNDGATTYSYDALGRMTTRGSTTYSYNGDGTLVYDGTTRYTQDLASPLSQVLQTTQGSATTKYLYGQDRLAAQAGSAKAWYIGDALRSVRMTLDDAGTLLSAVNYDPWGTPESGIVPTFGFTGELQDSAAGLVNLRARWYATGQGRFMARDPFGGLMEQPQTLHQYSYTESNPTNMIDPSGNLGLFVFGGIDDTTSNYKLSSPLVQALQDGIYHTVTELFPFVPGQSFYAAPLAVGNGPDNYEAWLSEACAAHDRGEPIVLFGYSRGAASVHVLAEALAHKNIRVALLVEVAMIPGPINLHGNEGSWDERPSTVDHLLSYRSEAGYLPIYSLAWANEYVNLQSENTVRIIPNTDHFTISWPEYRSRCLTTEDIQNPRLCARMIRQGGRAQVVWYQPVPISNQPPYPIRNRLVDEVKAYLIKTFVR